MRIGVDVGGTKIEGLALSDTGAELARLRVTTPRGDYEATVDAIAGLVLSLERDLGGEARVGLGTPGAIDPTSGRLKNSNSVALNGRPLARDVGAALAREVRIANDADCMALSEAIDGAAAGCDPVFGVIVGTGVGGGVVVGGRLVGGPNAVAGEWGHNALPWPRPDELPGPACYCGRRGCIETFLSGPALERAYLETTGARLPAAALEAAAVSDPAAAAVLERYADRMARALSSIINVLDPEAIVLGGGVSNIDVWYGRVPLLWDRYVFSDVVLTRLVKARHGDSSGVRGAAWLWELAQPSAGR
jgi:fructokinase